MKPFVFTLMPFLSSFDDIYKLGIKATCEELNSYCERVDEQIFQGSILDRIFNQIVKADVIVADMTGRNPNVFFEVGYAKALDKKLILLTSSADDIPFDLKHYTHVEYNNSIVKLKESLKTHLKFYFANLDKTQTDMFFGINLYVCGVKLQEGTKTKVEVPTGFRYIPLTVENVSGKTFDINSLLITARANAHFVFGEKDTKKFILDHENKEKWSLYNDTPIFHGAEYTYELCSAAELASKNILVDIDIFTSNGHVNYTIEITPKFPNKVN